MFSPIGFNNFICSVRRVPEGLSSSPTRTDYELQFDFPKHGLYISVVRRLEVTAENLKGLRNFPKPTLFRECGRQATTYNGAHYNGWTVPSMFWRAPPQRTVPRR